jgi:hypothetical protein
VITTCIIYTLFVLLYLDLNRIASLFRFSCMCLSVFIQLFETTEETLKRDKKSLLAQLCDPAPPVQPDVEGYFVFDRDWYVRE